MNKPVHATQELRIRSVEMRDIVKRFPGVIANSNVNFEVKAGEVHALLGENGAGKSTLMRQLYGLYRPDEGQILVDGVPIAFHSPSDAIKAGIGMIHQHFMLVPTLTVTENVALGLQSKTEPILDLESVEKRIIELSKNYGLKVDPSAFIWQLSVGEQQRVEIIKALYRNAGIIILDEPTAVLTPQEVNDLFETLKLMVQEGHGLIFISHKLHEVMQICDRVTVLRDGQTIGTRSMEGVTRQDLVQMMVGREVKPLEPQPIQPGDIRLKVEGLRALGDRDNEALKGIDLMVHSGEIVGVAGVSGNGQREFAQCLTGLRDSTAGTIELAGKNITKVSLLNRIDAGLAFVPEERMHDGVVKEFSVQDNYFLRDHCAPEYTNGIFMNFNKMTAKIKDVITEFNVKTPSKDTPIKNLSGGNIQKLILARELARKPTVLIAAQPSRGVDIGATEYIHKKLLEQRASGTAILLISEDLDEVRTLSDRIAVMFEGQIIGVVERDAATIEEIGLMMVGIKPENVEISPA